MKFSLCISTPGTLLARVDDIHLRVGLVGSHGNLWPKRMTVEVVSVSQALLKQGSTSAALVETVPGPGGAGAYLGIWNRGRCLPLRLRAHPGCWGFASWSL